MINMAKIVTLHDATDGIRMFLSIGPAVVTLTFCRYSSTIASISVELSSESEATFAEVNSKSDVYKNKYFKKLIIV